MLSSLRDVVYTHTDYLSVDIETSGLVFKGDKPLLLQLCNDNGTWLIDLREPQDWSEFSAACLDRSITKIGHNIKFDGNFLMYHFGVEMRGIYDTMIVEKILQGKIYFAKDPVKPKKEETEEEMTERKAQVEAELKHIEPVLEAARQAVGGIKKDNLNEIRSLKLPPEPIRDVLEGVLRLLGNLDTSWVSMKRFLGNKSVKDEIINFDSRKITPEIGLQYSNNKRRFQQLMQAA